MTMELDRKVDIFGTSLGIQSKQGTSDVITE
jgi:hypothetical protein